MISLKQSPHPTQHSQFMALRINLGQRHSIRMSSESMAIENTGTPPSSSVMDA